MIAYDFKGFPQRQTNEEIIAELLDVAIEAERRLSETMPDARDFLRLLRDVIDKAGEKV